MPDGPCCTVAGLLATPVSQQMRNQPLAEVAANSSPESSMSIRWPGRSLGSHAWVLIAMLQLAVDFPSCESLGPGPEFWLMPRPAQRPPRLWSLRSGQPSRPPTPVWSLRVPRVERAHGQMQVSRARRAHRPRDQVPSPGREGGLAKPPATSKSSPSLASSSSPSSSAGVAGRAAEQRQLRRGRRHTQDPAFNSFDFRGGRPTTETEFIAWGPTGDEEGPEANTFPGMDGPTTASVLQTRKTTVATTTTTAASITQTRGLTASLEPWRKVAIGVSTTEPSPSPSSDGKNTSPPRILGETSGPGPSVVSPIPLQLLVTAGIDLSVCVYSHISALGSRRMCCPDAGLGLAVHQIITITVSLIMVIAALITTLVLKNCCTQSGNTRRNSHQRKVNQQEESCQNLTDFTSARVPSSLDIFTAYNETLQCSHECVRASVPVYTDETLHPAGEYKSTFNGNRSSSADRHLIPVAFVSEKWFEISC
ncbi:Adherens junction-associated protein 1 [Heterocephalus glaber]|uniref:Adherens junction-associated protein 1 n=1 Tax=Heterocephalus glaber TaxID=10181 RepID=G5CBH9_HETGA|nr:Adherens junction-associated protein 1 [Heterocephalus glaber]